MVCLFVFVGITFHKTKLDKTKTNRPVANWFLTPHPQVNHDPTCYFKYEGQEGEEADIKTNIRVEYIMKLKVGDTEQKTRVERQGSTRKEVVGYVQDAVGKNNVLIPFKCGHRR